MLVLTRRLFEKIHIGDSVVVTVVSIGRGEVRLGVDAPRDMPVCRGDLKPILPSDAGSEDRGG